MTKDCRVMVVEEGDLLGEDIDWSEIVLTISGVLGRKISPLTLVFISAEKMREINKSYRDKDKSTNVLSFEDSREVLISIRFAKEEIKNKNYTLRERLIYLFIHGVLHLEGIHHDTKKDEKEMEKIEQDVMKDLKHIIYNH